MASKKLCVFFLILGLVKVAGAADLSSNSPNSVRQAPRILKSKDRNVGRYIADIEFKDVAGKNHRLSEFAGQKGLVIAATSTSCPLSKKYLPTLVRLANQYSKEGIGFVLVNPTSTDKPAAVRDAAAALGDSGIYVHDQNDSIGAALGLTSTTDVLLLDPARTVHYQGAVDDQYGFGYSLEAARKNYLVSAIAEYLKGHPVVVSATEAPGCHLATETTAAKTEVTYHNRVSRIMRSSCVECHRDGGIAPFSLETRADLVAHAKMIETVVSQGTMPPWFAAPLESEKSSSPWINDCSLNDSDKADLLAWLKSDKAEGDAKEALAAITYPNGWTIGQPDLVVKFPEAVPVQATGTMRYKNVLINTEIEDDKWVQAIEVRPSAPEVVHHILVFARVPGKQGRRESPNDDINYWGIYVPGNSKQVYPEGFARKLPKGSQIRLQIHYTPNGKETEDLTQVGFVFAEKDPENEVKTASLVNAWFEIPPGAENHSDSAKIKLPSDVTVLGFLPHMHLRGKACSYEMISPDGTKEKILDVPRYDFNWQILYRYAEPRTFTKGTTLKFNASFDNSDKNPANPDAQATVRWGDQTYDEMIVGYIEYFVPVGAKKDQLSDVEIREPGLGGGREEMMFAALDVNDDGKLSREEVNKLSENPRLKQANPLAIGALFVGLDTDQDGFLTLEEFKKISGMFGKKN